MTQQRRSRLSSAKRARAAIVWSCSCGEKRYARPVLGKFNAKKTCTAKCMSSTGFACECQCGGRNHGAAHA